MGTALTGNTISSSYLGLIKTTDSAAISSSAKVITDGAGNDSPLYLSTSRLGIGITPTSTLHVSGDFTLTGAFKDTSGDAGSSGQILSSTATGTNWIDNDVGDITSVVAGDGLTGGGTSGAVTINAGAGNLIDVQADQIDVDLSELTTSTTDADGDFFAVVDSANSQKKLTKGNINLSGFNNDIVSGTTGTLAKFTSSSAVGDSIVSESSSTLLIDPTAGGSHVGNIALTLLGVSGQDEQVYIYATGSSAENASIKLVPISGGYGHIMSSGNGLRLGSDSNSDAITLTSSEAVITVDVQLIGTAPNIIFNDSAVTKNIAKILGNVDSAGTNGGKLEFQTVADSGASYITALAIDDSQQVGIGTTTPSALLNLESSSTSALLIANRTNAVDGTKNLIDFKLDASDDNSYSAGSIGVEAEGTWSSTAGTRDGSIIFRPSVNGTDTTAVTIDSNSDIILAQTGGQSSDIKGDITDSQLTIKGGSAGAGVQLFGSTYTNYAGALYLDATASSTGTNDASIIMRTGSSPTTALTVDRSQNVGIGVAPYSYSRLTSEGSDNTSSNYAFIAYKENTDAILACRNDGQVTMPSGNVGMGTTAPTARLEIAGGSLSSGLVTNLGISTVLTTGRGGTTFDSSSLTSISTRGDGTSIELMAGSSATYYTGISATANSASLFQGLLRFITAGAERFRVDATGQVLIRRTVDFDASDVYCLQVGDNSVDNHIPIVCTVASTTTRTQMVFSNTGTNNVGSISTSASATAFNTSSDYRLKEDLKDFNGLEKISKIKMYDFKWKDNDDYDEYNKRGYGVLAHELKEVLPQAVNGEKDGNKMQGADYSKIVPFLVKAVQELKAEIDELKKK